MTKRPHVITCQKIDPSEHDIYDAYVGAEDYYEVDQDRPVGDEVVYGAYLTDEGVEAFRQAENLISVEEDVEDSVPTSEMVEDEASGLTWGVSSDALRYHGLFDMPYNGHNVVVGVGDTGATSYPYVWNRLLAKWTWFADDGMDRNGHGAWVLGAAIPAGARAVSGKVLGDNGSGYRSYTVAFIRQFARYCRYLGLPGVCNLSLGGPGSSEAYADAVAYAMGMRVTVLAATGNDDGWVGTPAREPGVVGIAAVDQRNDNRAWFSNYGKNVDLAASGVEVEGIGGSLSGTSMATPLASRVLAVLAEKSPTQDNWQARKALTLTAQPRGNPERHVGHGIVDGAAAIRKLTKG